MNTTKKQSEVIAITTKYCFHISNNNNNKIFVPVCAVPRVHYVIKSTYIRCRDSCAVFRFSA